MPKISASLRGTLIFGAVFIGRHRFCRKMKHDKRKILLFSRIFSCIKGFVILEGIFRAVLH